MAGVCMPGGRRRGRSTCVYLLVIIKSRVLFSQQSSFWKSCSGGDQCPVILLVHVSSTLGHPFQPTCRHPRCSSTTSAIQAELFMVWLGCLRRQAQTQTTNTASTPGSSNRGSQQAFGLPVWNRGGTFLCCIALHCIVRSGNPFRRPVLLPAFIICFSDSALCP